MDFSKFKVEVYDLLAVIIPGVLVFLEFWIALRGWSSFSQGIAQISASSFTVLLLFAFALGPLLQELNDIVIKKLKGKRCFKHGRDHLWKAETGTQVRSQIEKELGHAVESVDVAFDFCLTRIQGAFAKRDLFVANSDLARGMIVVTIFAVAPLVRIARDLHFSVAYHVGFLFCGVGLLFLVASIFWVRMARFRVLSETPVFHAYLAMVPEVKTAATAAK
ncbi:MAG: hypothetical protein LAO56_11455 [Acidobacteriia bacterium]|nr:hypothetical protein [Terriglobia bacterium]